VRARLLDRLLPALVASAAAGALSFGCGLGAEVALLVALGVALLTLPTMALTERRQRAELDAMARRLESASRIDRERSETILTDRNKMLAILSSMVEGVVAVDLDERVLHINALAADILRAPVDESTGRRVWEVTRVREVSEMLSATLEAGGESRRRIRLVAQPHDRVVELRAAPLRDGEGEVVGALAVLHDVSELERLEGVRREFVANVSHELKTPITAIRGLIETLVDDTELDDGTRSHFHQRILEQVMRLSTLVGDLLTLSRLQAEGRAPAHLPLDLRDPVGHALRSLAPLAEGRGIELTCTLPDDPVTVLGTDQELRVLASNLLDNALKYTPSGGHVSLVIRRQDEHVLVEVSDDGIGIDPRHQHRIFERFYRVDKARSRDLGGTGLGLAIVKHIVRGHGGSVDVESVHGEGSTFRVRLPLATAGRASGVEPVDALHS
jgi:two-component system phosphate regulon sensor histidine kinase PhoR